MEIYLSICIPTYNRVDQLKKLFDFLQDEQIQDITNVEIIVSNNFSNDGTKEYLRSLSRLNNLTVYNQTANLGSIGNIRFLQKKARGKFLWFVGDDDKLETGIIDRVLTAVIQYPELHHIFLNYSESADDIVVREKMYLGNESYFADGMKLFESVTADSGLGALMFITANVYLKDDIDKALEYFDSVDEGYNLALPLGYSLFCSQYPGFIIEDISVCDEIKAVSWKDKMTLVWCRDMIAICDYVGIAINKEVYVRNLLLKHLPKRYPEIMYTILGRKFKRDNYALKMYFKHFKIKLFIDFVAFPFYCLYKIMSRIFRNSK